MSRVRLLALCLSVLLTLILSTYCFAQAPILVTQPVDNSVRTVLKGNVHPLARAEYDQGEAPDSMLLHRMLLVLKRSDQQEAALRSLIDDQQDKHSARHHQWLAPEEFGAFFGPADSDVAAVVNWLKASGFEVNQVSTGRSFIEFNGTAGLVKQFFGTAIHSYAVNGGRYWANVKDPSIPTALSPVVAGLASLNNFPRRSHNNLQGPFPSTYGPGGPLPLFDFPFQGGTVYGVSPYDFATIYNVLPLWNASPAIDGSGQTIAIIGETDISLSDIQNFRSTFGLPANDPQFIVNGPDPGILQDGEETESVLDVSWSGAVAKGATIDFVVAATTETSAGTDLASIFVIDNNIAPVMSLSYGQCELFLGNSGNDFYNFLWEQAAAEGISVFLSAGDGGSAGCDNFDVYPTEAQYGLAVSGYASTPFNIAVGGTDFNQVGNISTYWNATNNSSNGESAKSYIPEMAWNESCAGVEIGGCTSGNSGYFDIIAGSGGPSNCAAQSGGVCTGGYSKPPWQTGTGVPNDSVRDTPDISLFASSDFNGSAYTICEADIGYICTLNPPFAAPVGGTSASAPAFAGIMALVNQQMASQGLSSRQGNANYILYQLAKQSGASCNSQTVAAGVSACMFYDIPAGSNNSVPCVANSPNCGPAPAGGFGILVDSKGNTAWTTNTGYDMVSGLGTVNVANLVNKWSTASFSASTASLQLSPVSITHGQTVTVNITVAAKNGVGTPTGDVALMGAVTAGKPPVNIDAFTLNGGKVNGGVTNLLPGGTYNVTAHYQGDVNFGGSDSSPVSVTVTPEISYLYMGNPPGLLVGTGVYGNSVVYGSNAPGCGFGIYCLSYLLRADILNSAKAFCTTPAFGEVACPTGSVTFTDNGSSLGTFNLNSYGFTEDQNLQLTTGSHILAGSYSGDASYQPSSISPFTVTVTQAPTAMTSVTAPQSANVNQQFTVSVTVSTSTTTNTSYGVAPTGTVTFLANGTALPGTVTYTPTNGNPASLTPASLAASLTTSIGTAGTYSLTASYSGDTNYTGTTTTTPVQIVISSTQNVQLPATLTNPPAANPGQTTATSMSVATSDGNAFASGVSFSCSDASTTGVTCSFSPTQITSGASSPQTVTITVNTSGPFTGAAGGVVRGTGEVRRRAQNQNHRPWLPLSLPLAGVVFVGLAGRGMDRRYKIAGLCLMLVLAAFLVACGGGGGGSQQQITVSVSANPASLWPSLAGATAQTSALTATVTGTTDTAVNWQVNGIANGNSTFGTITGTGNTVTYNAPATVPSPASFNITAISQADSSASGNALMTIKTPTPAGTTTVTVTATEGTQTPQQTTFSLTVN